MSALVLGHKNPDTDSIVAALAATNLYVVLRQVEGLQKQHYVL